MAITLKHKRNLTSRAQSKLRRQIRGRKKISGTAERPRLVVTRSSKHITAQVVDHLRADVARGAGDDQSRTLLGAGDALAAPDLTPQPRGGPSGGVLALLECDRHRHLPAFPTLRRTTSPA